MSDPVRSPATMRDVAALAGASIKTVSRVVNEEGFVSPAMVERVQVAARQLGYRPNLTASHLRRADRRTRSIGLLLEDVANPFSAALFRAIERVAHERDVLVLAASVDRDTARERQLVDAFGSRGVDGLIVVPTRGDQGYLEAERAAGTDIVFVDRPPQGIEGDVVLTSNRAGAEEATAHLVAHGHRRIAFLGDDTGIWTVRERRRGYLRALAKAGIEHDPRLVHCGLNDSGSAATVLRDLMAIDRPPTAVFTSQNLITVGAVTALRRMRLNRRVALVGFDDLPLAEFLRPGLTVVAQDPAALGAAAAQLLFRRIDGDAGPPRRRVIPTWLITRGSGEIEAVTSLL